MTDTGTIKIAFEATRKWREMEKRLLDEAGCIDFSYRPRSGMSALGWVLAHQAAVYDYSLNILIKQGSPKNLDLFKIYTPGTSGDWLGTPRDEIQTYYQEVENDLLEWLKSATESELDRVITNKSTPSFFQGMTVREVLMNTVAHLNYHTGHLTAIRRDWLRVKKGPETG